MLTFFNRHRGTAIFMLLGIVAILPFLLISFYCNPVAGDDFNVANVTRRMGFIGSQVYWYKTWTGRYFSNFLTVITPLVYGNFFLYKIIPVIVMGLLAYSFYLLLRPVFPALLRRDRLALTAGFMSVLLLQMPSTSEGIFWAICSYTYQLPNALTLFFLWSLYRLISTRRPVYFLLSALFSFAIIGSTETSMLVILYLQTLILFFHYLQNRKSDVYQLALLGVSVLFALIVIKAPGNSLRQQHFPNAHRFPGSVILTLKTSFTYLYIWLPAILMISVVAFDIIKRSAEVPRVLRLHPVVSFLIFLSFPLVCVFPVMWAVGNESLYLRIANVAYFFAVAGFFYFAFTLFFFLSRKYPDRASVSPSVLILVTALIAIRFFTPDNVYQPNNIRRVYKDILSGKAARHNTQMADRFRTISSAQADTLMVPGLKDVSTVLYPSEYPVDITKDPKDWRNASLSEYFGKGPVILAN